MSLATLATLDKNDFRAEGIVRQYQARHPIYIHKASILLDRFRNYMVK